MSLKFAYSLPDSSNSIRWLDIATALLPTATLSASPKLLVSRQANPTSGRAGENPRDGGINIGEA